MWIYWLAFLSFFQDAKFQTIDVFPLPYAYGLIGQNVVLNFSATWNDVPMLLKITWKTEPFVIGYVNFYDDKCEIIVELFDKFDAKMDCRSNNLTGTLTLRTMQQSYYERIIHFSLMFRNKEITKSIILNILEPVKYVNISTTSVTKTEGILGDNVSCITSPSHPVATIKWILTSATSEHPKTLYLDVLEEIENHNITRNTLILNSITKDADGGTLQCVATNGQTAVKSSIAYLEVYYKPYFVTNYSKKQPLKTRVTINKTVDVYLMYRANPSPFKADISQQSETTEKGLAERPDVITTNIRQSWYCTFIRWPYVSESEIRFHVVTLYNAVGKTRVFLQLTKNITAQSHHASRNVFRFLQNRLVISLLGVIAILLAMIVLLIRKIYLDGKKRKTKRKIGNARENDANGNTDDIRHVYQNQELNAEMPYQDLSRNYYSTCRYEDVNNVTSGYMEMKECRRKDVMQADSSSYVMYDPLKA